MKFQPNPRKTAMGEFLLRQWGALLCFVHKYFFSNFVNIFFSNFFYQIFGRLRWGDFSSTKSNGVLYTALLANTFLLPFFIPICQHFYSKCSFCNRPGNVELKGFSWYGFNCIHRIAINCGTPFILYQMHFSHLYKVLNRNHSLVSFWNVLFPYGHRLKGGWV